MLKVDYKSFPAAVQSIRGNATAINGEINAAFKAMGDCHSVWTGDRYKELVTKFNSIVDDVNSMLTLIVSNIPSTLEQIYNNYDAADHNETAKKATVVEPTKVNPIAVPGEEPLYVAGADVSNVQPYITRVVNNFDGAKGKLSAIKNQVDSLTWEGSSHTEFKSKLTTLKGKLDTAFDDISTAFKELATQAANAFAAAEKANNVANVQ